MLPKISVVIPVYNAENYLEQCLNSLINQTFGDWECILVNDASTDRTLQIIENHAICNPRIRYRTRNTNSGSDKIPRDEAVEMACSSWILSLDADDWLRPDALEKLYARQIETNADAILLRLVFTHESGDLTSQKIPSENFDFSQIMSGLDAVKLTIGDWFIAGNGMYRKTCYDSRHPIANGMNAAEYDTRQLLIAAKTVAFADAHYFYRKTGNSITRNFNVKLFDTLQTNKLLCGLIERTFPKDDPIVQTMHLQYFYDIINKRRLLFRTSHKLSRDESRRLKKLIGEHYENIRFIYPSGKQRRSMAMRYVLKKYIHFVVKLIFADKFFRTSNCR